VQLSARAAGGCVRRSKCDRAFAASDIREPACHGEREREHDATRSFTAATTGARGHYVDSRQGILSKLLGRRATTNLDSAV
jgi:hypothetical protein